MAEPNPKRAKMDNPGTSASSRPEERKIRPKGKLINTGTQNFEVIRNMRGFVDHTHFIQSFLLEDEPKLAIFAPRRFGKSSHLNMVKKFLQIDVDPKTGAASSTVKGSAKRRKNYKVFDGTRIITDDGHKELVEDHLGKHPVIHLDFKKASIASIKEAVEHCRNVVHRAYCEHLYLKTSEKLVPGDKEANADCQEVCRDWCREKKYPKQKLNGCLEKLAKYLCNHFDGAKVYILVDEFDCINASALSQVHGKKKDKLSELIQIGNILADLIGEVTKGGHDHVAGALVTGVSYVSGLGYSTILNNFTVMRFLDGTKIFSTDKGFVPFYGATTDEVRSLIQKLVRNEELMEFEGKKEFLNKTNELDVDKIMRDVQPRYNGYFDKNGTRIFCLWSVLQYLQSGQASNYWKQTDGIDNLYKILKCEKVASEIIKLLKDDELIELELLDKIKISDLVELHELMLKKNVDKAVPEVVFNFLMDQGFMSYPKGGGSRDTNRQLLKLPNAEIRRALSEMIKEVLKFWGISTDSLTCLINEISLSLMKDEKLLQDKMLDIYNAIPDVLRPLEKWNRAYFNEATFSCILYNGLGDAKSFDTLVESPIKDAEGKCIALGRPDFLLLHKVDKKCSILWVLKYKRESTDIYTTSLYALQEARGKIATKQGNIKNYMDPLKKLGRKALVIGLSVDSDLKASLSYSLSMKKKIYFMSETEEELCPDFYKTHNATSLLQKEKEKRKEIK